MYFENSKTLMKEIEDNTNRWKDIPCFWIGRIRIVKMTILPKKVYTFNVIAIKLPVAFFFCRTRTKILNLYGNTHTKKNPNSQSKPEKEKWSWEESGSLTSDYTSAIKTVCIWHKNRNIGQWSRIETPERNTHNYGQLIYNKGGKNIQWRRQSLQ